jgi:hypothetical protein
VRHPGVPITAPAQPPDIPAQPPDITDTTMQLYRNWITRAGMGLQYLLLPCPLTPIVKPPCAASG